MRHGWDGRPVRQEQAQRILLAALGCSQGISVRNYEPGAERNEIVASLRMRTALLDSKQAAAVVLVASSDRSCALAGSATSSVASITTDRVVMCSSFASSCARFGTRLLRNQSDTQRSPWQTCLADLPERHDLAQLAQQSWASAIRSSCDSMQDGCKMPCRGLPRSPCVIQRGMADRRCLPPNSRQSPPGSPSAPRHAATAPMWPSNSRPSRRSPGCG